MKTRQIILGSIFMLATLLTVSAQNEIIPTPAGLFVHGNNSVGGGGLGTPSAFEATDTVTVEAVMPYWVSPDPDAALSGTNSTFAWTISAALGTQTGGTPTNSATITFGSTPGVGTIAVVESAPAPASCPGTTTTINVQSIAKPSGQFGTTSSGICLTSAALAAQTLVLSPTLTTSIKTNTVSLTYTVTSPSAVVSAPVTVSIPVGGTFTIPAGTFTTFGAWIVTITTIDDRISLKSGVAGVVSSPTYTYTISKTPTTGSIFHKPNS